MKASGSTQAGWTCAGATRAGRGCDCGPSRLWGTRPPGQPRAAGLNSTYDREVAAGRVPEVPRQAVEDVYGEWWDKTRPGDTVAAQRAAAGIRHRAERKRQAAPAGLGDDRWTSRVTGRAAVQARSGPARGRAPDGPPRRRAGRAPRRAAARRSKRMTTISPVRDTRITTRRYCP